jgi:hypothetical protein
MSEQLDQVKGLAAEVLTKLLTVTSDGIDKAPVFFKELAEEYVKYFAISYIPVIQIMLATAAFLGGLGLLKSLTRQRLEDERLYDYESRREVLLIFSCCVFAVSLALAAWSLDCGKKIYQAYSSPRAFLIQELRK